MEQKAILDDFKRETAMIIKTSLVQTKFEYDMVKMALQCGYDPLEKLKSAIKVMNDFAEDGTLEWHVAEILKEIETTKSEQGGEE